LIYGTSEGSNSLLTPEEYDEIVCDRDSCIQKYKLSKLFLPTYVHLTDDHHYKVRIVKHKILGKIETVFDTLSEANDFIKQKLTNARNDHKNTNIVRNEEGIPIIPVTNHKTKQILWALVDEDDYDKLTHFKWSLSCDGYAQSCQIHMHRYVMGCSPYDKKLVDHINHNRLDNRKSVNLRVCTFSLNNRNRTKKSGCTSQYIGVSLRKNTGRWVAQMNIAGKKMQLGTFGTEIEAHQAYERAYNELVEKDRIVCEKLNQDYDQYDDMSYISASMPENAEITLMVDAIRDIMSGKRLKSIEVLGGRYMKDGQPVLANLEEISLQLPLKIVSINVKGKFSWIILEDDWYISLTFGMSGGIYYEPTEAVLREHSLQVGKTISKREYMKHFHIKFEADDGQCFYFGDARRFGTITISNDHTSLNKKINELGPDLLTGEPITDAQFIKIFRQPKFNNKNICRVLMEQHAVSGVGNYIKAEVLYECHINPWAVVSDIDDKTLSQLHQAIRGIVRRAYAGHGASLYTYTGTRREKGTFQEMLQVYGKNTDPFGNQVMTIPESESPDKRTTHYVQSVQTIGIDRDPNIKRYPTSEKPKLGKKIVITIKNPK
jgi:formamidopyrimidine-DNA glycosylase